MVPRMSMILVLSLVLLMSEGMLDEVVGRDRHNPRRALTSDMMADYARCGVGRGHAAVGCKTGAVERAECRRFSSRRRDTRLHPAALASVPYGIVLVRVQRRERSSRPVWAIRGVLKMFDKHVWY